MQSEKKALRTTDRGNVGTLGGTLDFHFVGPDVQ
ncbi:hypothetical protein J2Y68_000792 [Paenarthrobacter nitroguajacolicus]|nr:hypothetical protein [Paenarthrobacter nitroguajacolicus]